MGDGPRPASAAVDSADDTLRRPKGAQRALTRFRIMAFTTGVVLAFMTCIGMPYKFITQETTTWYSLGWMATGGSTSPTWPSRWIWCSGCGGTSGRALLILLAGTVPFMSFVAEYYVTKRVRPMLAAASVQAPSVQR